jgi:polyphenol oxidase
VPDDERLLATTVGPARAWCSNRGHGNVGDQVGDDPRAVETARTAVAREADLPAPTQWVWLRQVHGALVHDADGPSRPGDPPEADAAVTTRTGLPLAVVTADCAPIVLANDDALGVVHAGHRGLTAGVFEATVTRVRQLGHGNVYAFLGPCIRPAHYEFGPRDLEALVARFGPRVAARTRDGRSALDIPAAVAVTLERAGVSRFEDCGVCTADSPAYFSHRRDGSTGRQVTVAVL